MYSAWSAVNVKCQLTRVFELKCCGGQLITLTVSRRHRSAREREEAPNRHLRKRRRHSSVSPRPCQEWGHDVISRRK